MSMQHQRKHISPNFNLLQNFFLRCHFFIYSKNLVQQLWDLKQMVVHNSQDTPLTIFSNVLCSLAFLFNDNHLLKNASCKGWCLDMVSKVFQDIWANSKTESGLYNNMSIIGWNCDRKCNRNRLIVYQVYQPKKMHSLSPLRSELNRQWLYVIWYDGHPLGHVGSLRVLTMHNSWPCGLKINES